MEDADEVSCVALRWGVRGAVVDDPASDRSDVEEPAGESCRAMRGECGMRGERDAWSRAGLSSWPCIIVRFGSLSSGCPSGGAGAFVIEMVEEANEGRESRESRRLRLSFPIDDPLYDPIRGERACDGGDDGINGDEGGAPRLASALPRSEDMLQDACIPSILC